MENLHDAREATKDEAHNAEDHNSDVLPEDPVPLAKPLVPERYDFDDRWEDECKSAAWNCTDQRNHRTEIRNHRSKYESEENETDAKQIVAENAIVLTVETRAKPRSDDVDWNVELQRVRQENCHSHHQPHQLC